MRKEQGLLIARYKKTPWRWRIVSEDPNARVLLVYGRSSGGDVNPRANAEKAAREYERKHGRRDKILDFDRARSPEKARHQEEWLTLKCGKSAKLDFVVNDVSRIAHGTQRASKLKKNMLRDETRLFNGGSRCSAREFMRMVEIHELAYGQKCQRLKNARQSRQWRKRPPVCFDLNAEGSRRFNLRFEKTIAALFELRKNLDPTSSFSLNKLATQIASEMNRRHWPPPRAEKWTAALVKKHLRNPAWQSAYEEWCSSRNPQSVKTLRPHRGPTTTARRHKNPSETPVPACNESQRNKSAWQALLKLANDYSNRRRSLVKPTKRRFRVAQGGKRSLTQGRFVTDT